MKRFLQLLQLIVDVYVVLNFLGLLFSLYINYYLFHQCNLSVTREIQEHTMILTSLIIYSENLNLVSDSKNKSIAARYLGVGKYFFGDCTGTLMNYSNIPVLGTPLFY